MLSKWLKQNNQLKYILIIVKWGILRLLFLSFWRAGICLIWSVKQEDSLKKSVELYSNSFLKLSRQFMIRKLPIETLSLKTFWFLFQRDLKSEILDFQPGWKAQRMMEYSESQWGLISIGLQKFIKKDTEEKKLTFFLQGWCYSSCFLELDRSPLLLFLIKIMIASEESH